MTDRRKFEERSPQMRRLLSYICCFTLVFGGCNASAPTDVHRVRSDASARIDGDSESAAPGADGSAQHEAPDGSDASTPQDAAIAERGGALDAGVGHDQSADACARNHGGCDPLVKCQSDEHLGVDGRHCYRSGEPEPVFVGGLYVPSVGVDDAGNAIAVWMQATSNPLETELWVTRGTPDGGWESPTLIERANIFGYGRIAMNGSGSAMIAWTVSQLNDPIWASYYAKGTGWGPSMSVGSGQPNSQAPAVALDDEGNAIVAWEQDPGTTQDTVWANRYAADGAWGTAGPIEEGGAFADFPRVAFDHHGHAAVVWTELSAAHNGAVANRYTAASGWATEAVICSPPQPMNEPPFDAQVAMGGIGDIIAVWYQGDMGHVRVWSNRYTDASGWETAIALSPADAPWADGAKITMDAAGDAMAVWIQQTPDHARSEVWASRYDVASGWGTAASIDNDDAGSVTYVELAGDAMGNVLAVWERDDGFRMNRYDLATGWSAPTPIGASNATEASVAVSSAGHAIVLWREADGSTSTVWAQRMELERIS